LILLVEDNPNEEALVLRAFKKYNVSSPITVVRDGAEAVDFLFCQGDYKDRDPRDLPKLILLDMKLPKLSGLQILRRIRANERTHLLPVIMLTSSREEQDLIESYRSGANSYIRKPIDYDHFLEAIRQLSLYWLILNEPPPDPQARSE
jgi:two-component system, response regulator